MRRKAAPEAKAQVLDETREFLGDAMALLRRELARGADAVDVEVEDGKQVAVALCLVVKELPGLSGIRDAFKDLSYSGAMLGLSVEGISSRTAATYTWYAGLHGGLVFSTRLSRFDVVPRCGDDFWAAVSALKDCGGSLSYEENRVMTSDLPARSRRRMESSRSAVFRLARDIVLCGIEENDDFDDLGTLSVSWPLDTPAGKLLDGMCRAMQRFNQLNQHVHRIAYLDAKGSKRRANGSAGNAMHT